MKESLPEYKVKALREQAGLTQEQAAFKLGCSVKTIQSWDHGIQLPKIDNAAKLARLYGVSLAALFEAFNINTSGIPSDTQKK